MTEILVCWQCGELLTNLILPLSRREVCNQCHAEQHVCKLCQEYNVNISGACEEDRAEEVRDKERANFCDYFSPNPQAYSPDDLSKQAAAEAELAGLFGDGETTSEIQRQIDTKTLPPDEAARSALDDLFPGDGD